MFIARIVVPVASFKHTQQTLAFCSCSVWPADNSIALKEADLKRDPNREKRRVLFLSSPAPTLGSSLVYFWWRAHYRHTPLSSHCQPVRRVHHDILLEQAHGDANHRIIEIIESALLPRAAASVSITPQGRTKSLVYLYNTNIYIYNKYILFFGRRARSCVISYAPRNVPVKRKHLPKRARHLGSASF